MISKYSSLTTISLAAILLICLNVYGAMSPDISNWGFNRWSLVSTSNIIIISVIVIVIAALITLTSPSRLFNNAFARWSFNKGKPFSYICYSVGFLVLLLVLFTLRSRALVYGDGFSVIAHISGNPEQLIFDQYYLQIGSVLLASYVYVTVTSIFAVDPNVLFSLLNILGGIVGLIATYLISGLLPQKNSRWTVIAGTLSSGAVLLFFGHIEFYTWPLSFGLLSLLYSLRLAKGECSVWSPILLGICACFLHLIALPFLLVALFVFVWSRFRSRDPEFKLTARIINYCAVFFSGIVVLFFQSVYDSDVFVPIFTDSKTSYSAFSWAHIRDLLNLVIFLAPASLWFLFAKLAKRISPDSGSIESRALGCTALLAFLPSFWIDPTLGMSRDWDLLAMFGIPLSLYLLSRISFPIEARDISKWTIPLLIIAIVNMAPNIYANMDLWKSSIYLDNILWNDPHYQASYYKAKRGISWGSILRSKVDAPERAEKYFKRRISAEENEYAVWNTLAEMAFDRGDFDSAAGCFERSLRKNPNQPPIYLRLTQVFGLGERWDEALNVAKEALKFNPDEQRAKYNLAILLYRKGDVLEAMSYFQNIDDTVLMSSTDLGAYLGNGFMVTEQWDSAYVHLVRFVASHPNRVYVRESLLKTQIALGKYSDAAQSVSTLQKQGFPAEAIANYIRIIKNNTEE